MAIQYYITRVREDDKMWQRYLHMSKIFCKFARKFENRTMNNENKTSSMHAIDYTYTIQWVGPMTYEEYKKYVKSKETIDSSYFNFYYCEARKTIRSQYKRYLGIHKKNDGINKRVNTSHEHLGEFINEYPHFKLWIGSLGNVRQQKPTIIDRIETLFIRAYPEMLNENTDKKKKNLYSSISVTNLFYDQNEQPIRSNEHHPETLDDIVLFRADNDYFYHGTLRKMHK